MPPTKSTLLIALMSVSGLLLSESTTIANPPERTASESNRKAVATIDITSFPVVLANEGTQARSYADYRGGRPGIRYRYVYPRNYRAYPPRVYYYRPAYRYPAYVYPRTPNMMYYGSAVRVTYGPWVYAY